MSIEAMKQALEALEMCECGAYDKAAIKAVRQVIAEAEKQEPVAYMYPDDLKEFETREMSAHAYSLEMVSPTQGETVPLYTTPQQRKPLTHEQHLELHTAFEPHKSKWNAQSILIDMVEAAHGIKE